MEYTFTLTPVKNLIENDKHEIVGLKDTQNVHVVTLDSRSAVTINEFRFNDEQQILVEDIDTASHVIRDGDTYYYILNSTAKN